MGQQAVIQCVREIRPGGGVCGVAHALQQSMGKLGVETASFTVGDLKGSAPRKGSSNLYLQKARLLADVLRYSTLGTIEARRRLDRRRTLTHNDLLFGDVYVNHGLHRAMLDASGKKWRMLMRNPIHGFLVVREWLRFRLGVHEHYVCFSRSQADLLERYYPSTRGRTHIIPNGVDIERFTPDEMARKQLRGELGLSDDAFVMAFVGHEYERKGLYPLIESLRLLPSFVRLVVAGGSSQEIEKGRAAAAKAGVLERVTFLGLVKDVERVLNASEILVLPSRFEAWSLVGLESMACGIPPLLTSTGSATDYVVDNVNGRLIEFDAGDIADKVTCLLNDRDAYAAMKVAARETALRYSWDAIAARYLELLGVNAPPWTTSQAEKTDRVEGF